MDKTSFIMYIKFADMFNRLTDEEAGQLIKAIMDFQKTGEVLDFPGALGMAYMVMIQQMQEDRIKWEETCRARSAAGRNGANGRWKKETPKNEECAESFPELSQHDFKEYTENSIDSEQAMANDGKAWQSMANDGKKDFAIKSDGKTWQTMHDYDYEYDYEYEYDSEYNILPDIHHHDDVTCNTKIYRCADEQEKSQLAIAISSWEGVVNRRISPKETEVIHNFIHKYSLEDVDKAIHSALKANSLKLSYVSAALNNHCGAIRPKGKTGKTIRPIVGDDYSEVYLTC